MGESVPQTRRAGLLLRTENTRPRMAKADLRKADTLEYRQKVGRAVERTRTLASLTLDELSGKVQRDARQVARWISGDERPHFDALLSVDELRKPLLIAIAELVDGGVEIDTIIRVRIKESA